MQIHELNNYTGELGDNAYAVVDNGNDTGKVSIPVLLKEATDAVADVNARVDNIIAGGDAPSEAEIIDARHGANGADYPSLGTAIRTQVSNIESSLEGGTIDTYLSEVDLGVGYFTNNGTLNSSSGYRYGYIDIHGATSATITMTSMSDNAVVNVVDKSKTFKRNLYNWVGSGTYNINSFQDGDYYLCISCRIADTAKVDVAAVFPEGVIDELKTQITTVGAGIDSKMPLAKMYGGVINRELTDVVDGKYVKNDGTIVSSASWCYGYIDISDADYVVVDQTGISDSTIINFVDKDKGWITNLGTWLAPNTYTYSAIPYRAKYLCVSCKKVDRTLISYEVHPYAEIDSVEKNTDDSVRYDSAAAYVRTRTPNFIKGVHLDCGRKYFSVANIKLMIDAMYDAGLNTLQLYFSDNEGFRFGLDDMTITVGNDSYDLGDALGDGNAPTDGSGKWLTESDMDEIISYAHSKNIEIIPALNMPVHMGAIRNHFPVTLTVDGAAYGLSGEHGVRFMLAIIKKYADYFASRGSRFYNICSDEIGNAYTNEQLATFLARACKQITECHLTPMLYNDRVCVDGYNNPYINTGAVVYGWVKRNYQAPYSRIDSCGFRMINCASNYGFYWVLGTTVTDEARLNIIRNINIFEMADGSIMRNIKGAMYHIWCDQANLDGADDGDNVTSQVIPCIAAFGEAVAKYVPEDLVPMEQNVQTIEDIESMKNGGGLILRSANGTKYKLTIGNDGAIAVNSME